MKDNLSIVITIILLVVLIVIFPLYNYFERQDDMSYNLALKATTNFVDEVLKSGYITEQMYSDYISELANTGNIYDVSLEAHRKKLGPDSKKDDVYNEMYIVDYNNDILDKNTENVSNVTLESGSIKNGVYTLNRDDKFYVKLKNASTTMAGAIFNAIVPTSKEERIVVNYGGIVKNNAWEKVDSTFSAHMRNPELPVISTSKNQLETSSEGEPIIENFVSVGKITTLKAESAVYSVTGMEDNRVEQYVWQDLTNNIKYTVNPNNNEKIAEKIDFMVGKDYTFMVWSEDSYKNTSGKVVVKFSVTETSRPETPVVSKADEVLSTTDTNRIIIDDIPKLTAYSKSETQIAYYEWVVRDQNGNYLTTTRDITSYPFKYNNNIYRLTVYATNVDGETCEIPCTIAINVVEYIPISKPVIDFLSSTDRDASLVQVESGNTKGVYVTNPEAGVTYTWYVNGKAIITGKSVQLKIDKLMENEIYCEATAGRAKERSESINKIWCYNYNATNRINVRDKEEINLFVTTHNYYLTKINNLDGDKDVRYNWHIKGRSAFNKVEDSGVSTNSNTFDINGNLNNILLCKKNNLWFTGAAELTVYLSNGKNTIVSNKIVKIFSI